MLYGFTGRCLEVDLSTGEKSTSDIERDAIEAYLGGRGLATRWFFDRVPPRTEALGPENQLIFSVGALTGSLAPSANRTAMVTLSPQTGLLNYSLLGGYWGPELKQAGYDALIVTGAAPGPVYLWIDDNHIQIRPADHLWGQDVPTTRKRVQQELARPKAQLICIGPAGENRVMAASIEHSNGSGISRGGVGAVMGAKNLKAIVVSGSGDLTVARPEALQRLCRRIVAKSDHQRAYWRNWSRENGSYLFADGLYGNLDHPQSMEDKASFLADFRTRQRSRDASCYNCAVACKSVIDLGNGGYAHIKCQSYFSFVFACKIQDMAFSLKCYGLCERFGLDVISTAHLVGFAIDMYQKGLVTAADTGGFELRWGCSRTAFELIEQIATRRDLGAVLALGIQPAAQALGAGEHVHHVKKLETIPYQLYAPHSALMTAVADKPDMTRLEGFAAAEGFEFPREWKENYVRDGFFSWPQELEASFVAEYGERDEDYTRMVPFVSCDMDKNSLADCTGLCIFWTGFWRYNPINLDDHVALIGHVSGMDMDVERALTVGRRTAQLTRAYNVLTGIRREHDTVPAKFFRPSSRVSRPPLDRERFQQMLSDFYALRGWNPEGVPAADELNRLGLSDLPRRLQQAGLL